MVGVGPVCARSVTSTSPAWYSLKCYKIPHVPGCHVAALPKHDPRIVCSKVGFSLGKRDLKSKIPRRYIIDKEDNWCNHRR